MRTHATTAAPRGARRRRLTRTHHQDALRRAVTQLNPEQQECMVLRFLQGFSVAETAQATGKPRSAIKSSAAARRASPARLMPEGCG